LPWLVTKPPLGPSAKTKGVRKGGRTRKTEISLREFVVSRERPHSRLWSQPRPIAPVAVFELA
jgi:hypothetical protein